MAYIGYSSINAGKPRSTNTLPNVEGATVTRNGTYVGPVKTTKKFTLRDTPLVIRDLLNAFNIPQGQKVGQPSYGTRLWSLLFEPATPENVDRIEVEIRRVIAQDPRIILNSVIVRYDGENGVNAEIELAVSPFNQALLLEAFFNRANAVAVATNITQLNAAEGIA